MNYHGTLHVSEDEDQGGNYGYPFCHATWNTSIPDAPSGLVLGEQFSMINNSTSNDTSCRQDFVRPRLTFREPPLSLIRYSVNECLVDDG